MDVKTAITLDDLEQLLKDAARYRWLRNEAKGVDWSQNISGMGRCWTMHCRTKPQRMDEEIDRAIKDSKS
jgi:hypothetical protein